MSIFDDIRASGATYRLTEEALYAEALREIESGQRRDGLWAKSLADNGMDQAKAQAAYIKKRVQSLRDEITFFVKEQKRLEAVAEKQTQLQAPVDAHKPRLKLTSDSKPPRPIRGALQGGLAGVVGFFFLGLLLAGNPRSQFQFTFGTFLFFVIVGTLVGLAFSSRAK